MIRSLPPASSSVGSCQPSAVLVSGFPARHATVGLSSRAFTLIELLVVMAVVAVLAGITLGAMGGVQQKAARDRTKAELAVIANALESYKSQQGSYPQPASGGIVPYAEISGYLTDGRIQVDFNRLKDPFGGEYFYVFPGERNRASYDLFSMAGASEGEVNKHIGNW